MYCDANPDNDAGIQVDHCNCDAPNISVVLTGAPPGHCHRDGMNPSRFSKAISVTFQ